MVANVGADTGVATQGIDSSNLFSSHLSFWITVTVVVVAGIVNFWLSSRTMANQTDQAAKGRQADHQNKISEYRHEWLQELRNTAAELVKAIHEAQNTLMQMNLSRDYADKAVHDDDEELESMYRTRSLELYQKERLIGADIYKFTSKIKLLFKKDDPQTKALFKLLDAVKAKLGDLEVRQLDNEVIESITSELQIILKDEWEVTKRMIVKGTASKAS